MEAVISTGGKQYRVAPGQVITVERLGKSKGAPVEFNKVLLVNKDGQVTVEPAALATAKVTGQVVAERKGAKVLVVKFKRRKNYRRHRGHRQTVTQVRITKIESQQKRPGRKNIYADGKFVAGVSAESARKGAPIHAAAHAQHG